MLSDIFSFIENIHHKLFYAQFHAKYVLLLMHFVNKIVFVQTCQGAFIINIVCGPVDRDHKKMVSLSLLQLMATS